MPHLPASGWWPRPGAGSSGSPLTRPTGLACGRPERPAWSEPSPDAPGHGINRLGSPGASERHRPAHFGDRKPRRLRRLPPDGDRRRLPRRERGRDALRGRARVGCLRGRAGRPVRQGDPVRLLGVRGDGARWHARVHARSDRRLGDRRLRRTSVSRAPRPLAAPLAGAAREGGALVRPLGRQGRLPGPDRADRALVHLDPGRRLPDGPAAVHLAHARRLDDLVSRVRRRSATRSGTTTRSSTRRCATSTTSSSPRWWRWSPSGSCGAGGSVQGRTAGSGKYSFAAR